MEYREIKKQIEKFSRTIYYTEKKQTEPKPKIMLMVSHTLRRGGGAPLVLLELIPFFQKEYNIIFLSREDGELRDEYLKYGLDICIGDSVDYAVCEREVWGFFDLVFLNTMITYTYLPFFLIGL